MPQRLLLSPHDKRERVGSLRLASPAQLDEAITSAAVAAHRWDMTPAAERARVLTLAADLYERDRAILMAALVREAGKTLEAAQAEIREAVDYLRYYATEARAAVLRAGRAHRHDGRRKYPDAARTRAICVHQPVEFSARDFHRPDRGGTGRWQYRCREARRANARRPRFSPSSCCMKPACPGDVLQLVTGGGKLGEALIKDPRIQGVVFTGSNDTARAIQKSLFDRRGAIVPFIAETGGINAMIADLSALPEQVVRDAVRSAFDSAGQRCSAARVLFVQDDSAPRIKAMLTGAIEALDVGDPLDYATDIGPVIDEAAQDALEGHKVRMQREGRELIDLPLPDACRAGTYVTPALYEIDRMERLDKRSVRADLASRAL